MQTLIPINPIQMPIRLTLVMLPIPKGKWLRKLNDLIQFHFIATFLVWSGCI